jgi:hypothetical protein
LCPISYMLMAFPFAYYFLNKNKNLKTASE